MDIKAIILVALVVVGISCLVEVEADAEALYAVVGDGISTKEITKGKLKSICMGKTTYWKSGKKVSLLMRPPNSPAGQQIFKVILKMVPSRYQHYWNEQKLSGRGLAPRSVSAAGKVAKMVGSRAGAISFISESERKMLTGSKATVIRIK